MRLIIGSVVVTVWRVVVSGGFRIVGRSSWVGSSCQVLTTCVHCIVVLWSWTNVSRHRRWWVGVNDGYMTCAASSHITNLRWLTSWIHAWTAQLWHYKSTWSRSRASVSVNGSGVLSSGGHHTWVVVWPCWAVVRRLVSIHICRRVAYVMIRRTSSHHSISCRTVLTWSLDNVFIVHRCLTCLIHRCSIGRRLIVVPWSHIGLERWLHSRTHHTYIYGSKMAIWIRSIDGCTTTSIKRTRSHANAVWCHWVIILCDVVWG